MLIVPVNFTLRTTAISYAVLTIMAPRSRGPETEKTEFTPQKSSHQIQQKYLLALDALDLQVHQYLQDTYRPQFRGKVGGLNRVASAPGLRRAKLRSRIPPSQANARAQVKAISSFRRLPRKMLMIYQTMKMPVAISPYQSVICPLIKGKSLKAFQSVRE